MIRGGVLAVDGEELPDVGGFPSLLSKLGFKDSNVLGKLLLLRFIIGRQFFKPLIRKPASYMIFVEPFEKRIEFGNPLLGLVQLFFLRQVPS